MPSPPPGKTPFAASLDIRFVGSLAGIFWLPSRSAADGGPTETYAGRALSLSPSRVVLEAARVGEIGERVSLRLEHLGLVRGAIAVRTDFGFQLDVVADGKVRAQLAARINWLKQRHLGRASNKRQDPRVKPKRAKAHLYVDDADLDCSIIDMSQSGVAVAAAVMPAIGRRVVIGQVAGIVARHFDDGIGIRFETPRDLASLEGLLTTPR